MKKYRLSTTISPEHWSLLKKYSEKYETQQKALEKALESLDNSSPDMQPLSDYDKTWLRVGRELGPIIVVFPKEYFKTVAANIDLEDFRNFVDLQKPTEFSIEFYYRKLLSTCSLKEFIDGMLITIKVQGSADSVKCEESADCYDIYISHTFGINHSKIVTMMYESAMKTYGARFESAFSERTVFFKVFKNNGLPNNGGTGA